MGICCVAQEIQTGICVNLEGWDGEGDSKGRDIHIPTAGSC